MQNEEESGAVPDSSSVLPQRILVQAAVTAAATALRRVLVFGVGR